MPPPTLVCYICGREFGSSSLSIHQEQCKKKWIAREELKPPKERLPLPEPPKEIAVGKSREEQNEAAINTYYNEALVACEFCQRKFLPEKLAVHNRSCTAESPAKKVGEGAQPRKGEKVFGKFVPGETDSNSDQISTPTNTLSKSSVNKKIKRAVDYASVIGDCSDASTIDEKIINLLVEKSESMEKRAQQLLSDVKEIKTILASLKKNK